MAKLLFPSEDPWFDELRIISSYSEAELEKMIMSHVDTVFPNYVTIPFKKPLSIPGATKGRAPDLAIISVDYSEWWIIEVETEGDNLSHVKSQVEVFAKYDYNSYEIAKYIVSKSDLLDIKKVLEMVKDVKPKVLVMVDELTEEWEKELTKAGATICIFQVYKNKEGAHAFRIHGKYPKIFKETKSHCEFIKSPANTIIVHEPEWLITALPPLPTNQEILAEKVSEEMHQVISEEEVGKATEAALGEATEKLTEEADKTFSPAPQSVDGREVEIEFVGKLSKWKIILDEDKLYLKSVGINKVPVINTYTLYTDDSLKLYLQHN
jgi:hypothetical protein